MERPGEALALGVQEGQGVSGVQSAWSLLPTLVDFPPFSGLPLALSGETSPLPALLLGNVLLLPTALPHTCRAAPCAGSHASPGLCLHQLTFSGQAEMRECPQVSHWLVL